MPMFLKTIDGLGELATFRSVLIVPCRFCPAASMAVTRKRAYLNFFRHFLKTGAYETLIASLQSDLRQKEIRADVFKSRWLHQFVVCMWTSRRRKQLAERARKYEALLVLGCEAAADTVHDAIGTAPCKVFQGMKAEGVMGVRPRFELPCRIFLELNTITPLVHQAP